jgi:Ca2+-transporting ATPase
VVTISLAIGVQRMARRNALIRRLSAVETLGSVSVICSDKTGTLTKDEMTVRKVYVAGRTLAVSGSGYDPNGIVTDGDRVVERWRPLELLLQAGALASDARLAREAGGGWTIEGDPTEGALVVAAAKAGLDKAKLDAQYPRTGEIPFTSESKRMTTLHAAGDETIGYAKGAPEIVLGASTYIVLDSGVAALDSVKREEVSRAARHMAEEALRVLAVAYKPDARLENVEREMTFLGLVGMIDPPRPEAKVAIETCGRAGIKPVMITGDHPTTASAVARELGLLTDGRVLTGAQLDSLQDADLEREVERLSVYARVSPGHKLRVISALQRNRHFVGSTMLRL